MSTEEIVQRTRLLDSEIKVSGFNTDHKNHPAKYVADLQPCMLCCLQIMKSEVLRVTHELQAMKDKIKENTEKIKVNKTLPYLVSNVIEVSHLSLLVLFKYMILSGCLKMHKTKGK